MIPLLPIGLSIAGGLAPGIINSLMGGKSEEEARQSLGSQYDSVLNDLMGKGIARPEAERQADEHFRSAIEQAKGQGPIPPWAEALLGMAGGVGGWAAGAKLAGKGLAAASKVAATTQRPPFPPSMTTNLAKDEAMATTGAHYPGMWEGGEEVGASKVGHSGTTARVPRKGTHADTDEAFETTRDMPPVDMDTPETVLMGEAGTVPDLANAATQMIDPRLARTQRMPGVGRAPFPAFDRKQ